MLGAILGRSQGLLRRVDVEGVTWEVMWKHNKSEFEGGLIYYWALVFPQKQLLVGISLSSPSSLDLSQSFIQSRIVSESPQSHPTASQFSTSLYSTSHLVPLAIGHFLSPHTTLTIPIHLLRPITTPTTIPATLSAHKTAALHLVTTTGNEPAISDVVQQFCVH